MKEIRNYPELQLTCCKIDDRNDYHIMSSKTGNEYELLEGMAYKGSATSDIIFIL